MKQSYFPMKLHFILHWSHITWCTYLLPYAPQHSRTRFHPSTISATQAIWISYLRAGLFFGQFYGGQLRLVASVFALSFFTKPKKIPKWSWVCLEVEFFWKFPKNKPALKKPVSVILKRETLITVTAFAPHPSFHECLNGEWGQRKNLRLVKNSHFERTLLYDWSQKGSRIWYNLSTARFIDWFLSIDIKAIYIHWHIRRLFSLQYENII